MLADPEKKALSDLKTALDALALPMLIVGAGARILVFDQRQKIQGRATKDWDVAVSIDNWNTYQALSHAMTTGNVPRFERTRTAHRFIHLETKVLIDIVPFGKIGEPDQEIEWPDSGNPMNVAGFSEALEHARTEQIDDLELQVVDTPALIALKLLAWGDRGNRTSKDLDDIDFILRHYSDDERVYTELANELSSGELEYRDAAIYLLGQDIRKILRDTTLKQLNALLEQLTPALEDIDEVKDLPEYRLKVLQVGINHSKNE